MGNNRNLHQIFLTNEIFPISWGGLDKGGLDKGFYGSYLDYHKIHNSNFKQRVDALPLINIYLIS